MNTHTLEVVPSTRYAGETEIAQTGRNVDVTLERYGFGFVGPDKMCRRVHGGPLVPGPYAYAYRLANVLDGRKLEDDAVNFHMGDRFCIEGFTFQSRRTHNDNMELDLVS